MHVHCLRDVVQHQGLHRLLAIGQEVLLHFDDLGGHLEQGVVAALQAFEEPAGLGQIVAQKDVVRAVVGALHQARIARVDAQPGQGIGVQFHPPAPVDLLDHHFGNDVQGRFRRVGGAGTGVELSDEGCDLRQFPFAELRSALERGKVLCRQQVQMRFNQIDGLLAPWGFRVELL